MSLTSKTGLLPAYKKKYVESNVQVYSEPVILDTSKVVRPAPFTLRPYAGIYNPFPYGCSILCNHPADLEAKSIVKKARDAWAIEGKSLIDMEEVSKLKYEKNSNQSLRTISTNKDTEENVPEELFRKYTDTDSRPVTPAPTLASFVTKNIRTRRCMTPDPTSFTPAKEKTLLVLDLRRSHSQDTVYWQSHADDQNFDNEVPEESMSKSVFPKSSLNQNKMKATKQRKVISPSPTTSSLKTQTSKESDSKAPVQYFSENKNSTIPEQENFSKTSQISQDESCEIIKRRGKKTKKGKKVGKGDKEFQGIPDPRETQVSALENDSKEGSSRESFTEEKVSVTLEKTTISYEIKTEVKKDSQSFLNEDTIIQLQRQLDKEVVDSELNAKRKIALEEALKHKKNSKPCQQGVEIKNLKKEFEINIKNSEKWLSIPRVFTRRSARFELPMDSRLLNYMTPLQYVQNYAFASPERLLLYNHVFNLHKEDPEDDEESNRIILGKNIIEALTKIMGRAMTSDEANDFKNLVKWENEAAFDFRTFAGISALCERLLSSKFCSKILTHQEDPRHEIEIADFETLDEKLLRLNPDQNLVKILTSIRDA